MSAPLATIQTSSQPWPKQSSEINDSEYEKQVLTLALIIGMALSQIAPTFADGILKERQVSYLWKQNVPLQLCGCLLSTFAPPKELLWHG
jgi:hypothetical protein